MSIADFFKKKNKAPKEDASRTYNIPSLDEMSEPVSEVQESSVEIINTEEYEKIVSDIKNNLVQYLDYSAVIDTNSSRVLAECRNYDGEGFDFFSMVVAMNTHCVNGYIAPTEVNRTIIIRLKNDKYCIIVSIKWISLIIVADKERVAPGMVLGSFLPEFKERFMGLAIEHENNVNLVSSDLSDEDDEDDEEEYEEDDVEEENLKSTDAMVTFEKTGNEKNYVKRDKQVTSFTRY